jgi:hypothetical protein
MHSKICIFNWLRAIGNRARAKHRWCSPDGAAGGRRVSRALVHVSLAARTAQQHTGPSHALPRHGFPHFIIHCLGLRRRRLRLRHRYRHRHRQPPCGSSNTSRSLEGSVSGCAQVRSSFLAGQSRRTRTAQKGKHGRLRTGQSRDSMSCSRFSKSHHTTARSYMRAPKSRSPT